MLYPKEEDHTSLIHAAGGQSLHPYSAKYTMGVMQRVGAQKEMLYKVQVESVSW